MIYLQFWQGIYTVFFSYVIGYIESMDDKSKRNVVQKGRFSVTSENVDLAKVLTIFGKSNQLILMIATPKSKLKSNVWLLGSWHRYGGSFTQDFSGIKISFVCYCIDHLPVTLFSYDALFGFLRDHHL